MENLIHIIKNFDKRVKEIMIKGLYFSLAIAIIATFILVYYIYISHNNLTFYIGIEMMHLAISFSASFIACGIVIDKVKKDLFE